MLLEENKALAPFTTFEIGGPARWFTQATSENEVREAASWATERGIPIFVLGGGSNVLVSDAGFQGLVLRIALRGLSSFQGEEPHKVVFQIAAGEDWDQSVQRTVEQDCAGLECLAGIPGTVGGTPVQNVGAYGQEVASVIDRVRALDLQTHSFVEFTVEECGFAYRRSRFNSVDRGRYIVTRVDYRLTLRGAPTLRYIDLQRAFPSGSQPTLLEVARVVRSVRQTKGMLMVEGDPDCRSAGSFFKNPVVEEADLPRIAAIAGKEFPRFPAGSGEANQRRVKIPAAWLIEQSGFAKGFHQGSAGISSRHTLALVNRGGAKAQDILDFAASIKAKVENRFGILLEMEPVLVGY